MMNTEDNETGVQATASAKTPDNETGATKNIAEIQDPHGEEDDKEKDEVHPL